MPYLHQLHLLHGLAVDEAGGDLQLTCHSGSREGGLAQQPPLWAGRHWLTCSRADAYKPHVCLLDMRRRKAVQPVGVELPGLSGATGGRCILHGQ